MWCIEGFSLPKLCVACATERLETKDELQIHVKKVLSEFQALLSASSEGDRSGCRLCGVSGAPMWTPLWYVLIVLVNTPERYLTKPSHTGLLLSKDVSIAQLSLGGNKLPFHMAYLYMVQTQIYCLVSSADVVT